MEEDPAPPEGFELEDNPQYINTWNADQAPLIPGGIPDATNPLTGRIDMGPGVPDSVMMRQRKNLEKEEWMQRDGAPTPEVTAGGFRMSVPNSLLQAGQEATGHALQGIGGLSEMFPPNAPVEGMPLSDAAEAENQKWFAERASIGQRRSQLERNPLFIGGGALAQTAAEVHPVVQLPWEAESYSDKAFNASKAVARGAGGFFPAVAGGPLAPAIIGLQTAGAELSQGYDQLRASGLSEDQAASTAAQRALANGTLQAMLFELLPARLKAGGDAALNKFAYDGAVKFSRGSFTGKRFLTPDMTLGRTAAQFGVKAGEGAAFGAASQLGSNIVDERPWGEGLGEAAAGMALAQMVMPRGLTKEETQTYKAKALELVMNEQNIQYQKDRQTIREQLAAGGYDKPLDQAEVKELTSLRMRDPKTLSEVEQDRLRELDAIDGGDKTLDQSTTKQIEGIADANGHKVVFKPLGNTGWNAVWDRSNNQMVINSTSLSRTLAMLPKGRRQGYLESLMNEEGAVHRYTSPEEAMGFYKRATPLERKAAAVRYFGNKEGVNPTTGKEATPQQLGDEMVRLHIQQMMKMTPTEIAMSAGGTRQIAQIMVAMENMIRGVRKGWHKAYYYEGGTINGQQAILDAVYTKIQKAKEIAKQQAQPQQAAVGAAVPTENPFSVERSDQMENPSNVDRGRAGRQSDLEDLERAGKLDEAGKTELAAIKQQDQGKVQKEAWMKSMMEQMARNKPASSERGVVQELSERDPGETSVEEMMRLSPTEANDFFKAQRSRGNDNQNDGVKSGLKLTAKDVPELIRLRDAEQERWMRDFAAGKDTALSGKITWLNGVIEGANRQGPNYDLHLQKEAPGNVPRGGLSKKAEREIEQKKKIAALKLQAQGQEIPPELKVPSKAEQSEQYPPTPAAERVGSEALNAPQRPPLMTTQNIESSMDQHLAGPIEVANKKYTTKQLESGRVKWNRPSYGEFARQAHYDMPGLAPHQLRDMWENKVWNHLLKAPGERLMQWVKALGLQNVGRTPEQMRKGIGGVSAVPDAVSEANIKEERQFNVAEAVKKRAAGMDKKAAELRRQAAELKGQADVTEPSLFGAVSKRDQQVASMNAQAAKIEALAQKIRELPPQSTLPKANTGKAEVTPGLPLEFKSYAPAEYQEMLKNQPAPGAALPANMRVAPVAEPGAGHISNRFRTKLILAIADRLMRESVEGKPELDRTSVGIDDLAFTNEKTKVGTYHEITREDLNKPGRLLELLRDSARGSSSDPVSASRRVVVVVGKDGTTYLLSTFNDAGKQRVTEPSGPTLRNKPNRPLDATFLQKYRPIASVLLTEPVRGLHQKFETISKFNDEMGTEAKQRSETNDLGFVPEGPAPEDFEAEGTPGLEGEGGMFMGPKKTLIPAEGRRPALKDKRGLTHQEAMALYDHIYSEAGEMNSPEDVINAVEGLRDLKERGKLAGRELSAANALRKMFARMESKGNEAESVQDRLKRMALKILELHDRAKDMDAFAGMMVSEFGPRPGAQLAVRNSERAKELTKPSIRPPTSQNLFAGPFQRVEAPSAEMGVRNPKPYIPESVSGTPIQTESEARTAKTHDVTRDWAAAFRNKAAEKEQKISAAKKIRDRALRNRGKLMTYAQAAKLAGYEGPMNVPRGELDIKNDRTFITSTERMLGQLKVARMPSDQLQKTLRNKVPRVEWELLNAMGIQAELGRQSARYGSVDTKELADWIKRNGPDIYVVTGSSLDKGEDRADNIETQELDSKIARIRHGFIDRLTSNQLNDIQNSLDELFNKQTQEQYLKARNWSPDNIKKVEEYYSLIQQKNALGEPDDGRGGILGWDGIEGGGEFDRSIASLYRDYGVMPSDGPVHRVDLVLRSPLEMWPANPGHSPLPNTIGWAAVQFVKGPDGKNVAHIFEVQSDWAKAVKRGGVRMEGGEPIQGHPVLNDYNRLILKAVIEYARKNGVQKFVISDYPTAAMTEGHDKGAQRMFVPAWQGHWAIFDYQGNRMGSGAVGLGMSKEQVEGILNGWKQYLAEERIHYRNPDTAQSFDQERAQLERAVVRRVTKEDTRLRTHGEEGMRFNYDPAYRLVNRENGEEIARFTNKEEANRYVEWLMDKGHLKRDAMDSETGTVDIVRGDLHKIASDLTGEEGKSVSLGEHINSIEDQGTEYVEPEHGVFQTRREAEDFAGGDGRVYKDANDEWIGQKPEIPRRYYKRYRKDLIFKNAEGKPKIDASGMEYPIPNRKDPWSMFAPMSSERGKLRDGYYSDYKEEPPMPKEVKDIMLGWWNKTQSEWDNKSEMSKQMDAMERDTPGTHAWDYEQAKNEENKQKLTDDLTDAIFNLGSIPSSKWGLNNRQKALVLNWFNSQKNLAFNREVQTRSQLSAIPAIIRELKTQLESRQEFNKQFLDKAEKNPVASMWKHMSKNEADHYSRELQKNLDYENELRVHLRNLESGYEGHRPVKDILDDADRQADRGSWGGDQGQGETPMSSVRGKLIKGAKDFLEFARSPSVPHPEDLIVDTQSKVPRFASNIDQVLTKATGLERIPILGRLMGPRGRMRNAVDQVIVGYSVKRNIGNSQAAVIGKRLNARNEELGNPFQQDADGKITNVQGDANQSMYPSDLFETWQRQYIVPEKMRSLTEVDYTGQNRRIYTDKEITEYITKNPETLGLNKNQDRLFREMLEYLEDAHEYLAEKNSNLDYYGGESKETRRDQMKLAGLPDGIEVHPFPRIALYKKGQESAYKEVKRRIGGSYGVENERLYDTEQEGQKSVVYEPDMVKRMVAFIQRTYKAVADADLANNPVLGAKSADDRVLALSREYADDLLSGRKKQKDILDMTYRARLGIEAEVQGHGAFAGKVYPAEIAKKLNRSFGEQQHHIVNALSEASTMVKAFMLTGDLAQYLQQGGPMMFRHPGIWANATIKSLKAIADPNITGRYLLNADNYKAATEFAQSGGSLGHLQDFMSGSQPGELATRVPVIRQIVTRSGQAFGTFFDIAKIEMWKALRESTPKDQWGTTIEMIDNIVLSGKMESAGLSPGRATGERIALMAAAYLRGAAQLVAGMAERGVAGKQARIILSSYVGGLMATMTGLYLASGMSWEEIRKRLTPGLNNKKFLAYPIKTGNSTQEIGPGGIVLNLVSLATDIGMNANDPKAVADLSGKWLQTKFGPALSTGSALLSGKNAYGQPQSRLKTIGQNFMPIAAQRMLTGATSANKLGSAVSSAASFVGMRSSTSTPLNDIYEIAQEFLKDNDLKKETGWELAPVDEASYTRLRSAASRQDQGDFNDAYEALSKTHTPQEIRSAMKNWFHRGFTGSKANEKQFIASLTDYQLKIYEDALEAKSNIYEAYNEMFSELP